MIRLEKIRSKRGISQRQLATLSGVSFRTIQLLEAGGHDPQLSTLQRLATSLGYPSKTVERGITHLFTLPADAVAITSQQILEEGEESWKIWLFNFVDSFREDPRREYIDQPPAMETPVRIKALFASTTETLCDEKGTPPPEWCAAAPPLAEPWFVAGIESLKPMALVESPIHFRKRNIFVLENFLSRK